MKIYFIKSAFILLFISFFVSCDPSEESIGKIQSSILSHSFSDNVNPGYYSAKINNSNITSISTYSQQLKVSYINSNDGYSHNAYYNINFSKPFTFSADVRKQSGINNLIWGIGFGNSQRGNYFHLTNDSTWQFSFNENGWNDYIDWTSYAFNHTQTNKLSINAVESDIKLYINNVLVGQYSSFTQDNFSYIVLYTQSDISALFDNINIIGQRITFNKDCDEEIIDSKSPLLLHKK